MNSVLLLPFKIIQFCRPYENHFNIWKETKKLRKFIRIIFYACQIAKTFKNRSIYGWGKPNCFNDLKKKETNKKNS